MLSRLARTLHLGAALVLSGCMNCEYLGWHPIITSHKGQQICARHHIPLITVSGYQLSDGGIVLFHFHGQSYIADYCNPNHIDPHFSLQRSKRYSIPVRVTYCTLCEQAWQQHWNSPAREQPASWWQQVTHGVHLSSR